MTACSVAGCRNASKRDWSAYICGPHWRMIPKREKRRLRAVARAIYRRGWATDPNARGGWRFLKARGARAYWLAWRACERAAFRAAAGL